MRRKWIGILLLLAAMAQTPARAQYPKTHRDSPGNIQGTVVSPKGAPVPGAQILWQPSDGEKPHALHADAQGHFHIAKLRPGLYELSASTKGMSSGWFHNVLVRPGAETSFTLSLKPVASPEAKRVSAPGH